MQTVFKLQLLDHLAMETFEFQCGGYMSLFFDWFTEGKHSEPLRKGSICQIVQVLLQDQQNPSVVDMAMKIFARLETSLAAGHVSR